MVCTDSCSNSHARFQRADVFTGASRAYFPQGDASHCRTELELKCSFTRNTSLGNRRSRVAKNMPGPDAACAYVYVCAYVHVCASHSGGKAK